MMKFSFERTSLFRKKIDVNERFFVLFFFFLISL